MPILNQARKTKNRLDIKIYGPIGSHSWWSEDMTSADDIYKELENFGEVEDINLYINSPGGSVTDGCAIYSALKRHKARVNVFIDGQCSSIASVIAMAGDKIVMSPVSTMMIHNPVSALAGEAKDMRHLASVLDIMKETIINAYVTKSSLSREEISELMNQETYFTSKQAIEKGFATEEAIFDIKNSEFSNLDDFKVGEIQNVKNSEHTENKEGDNMAYKDAKELEAQNKDLVAEIKNATKEEVLAEERKRIADLEALNEKTKGVCKDIIDKAKQEGKTKADIIEDVLESFATSSMQEIPEGEIGDIVNIRNKESQSYEGAGTKPYQKTDNLANDINDIVKLMK
ncbi:Clp protease ClpP [Fusobacterium necrophorum]|uniref:head maturation protease, ClpP-related n=1 Tax=Fusobacterium necrophorum TaxID=859 RepID=UPI0025516252|nr:head maturation protease, ClpP-related [Fusobacterium necrophorum]MDK4516858.1 Clp protease ClpP [Fusobacterium necrophorum]